LSSLLYPLKKWSLRQTRGDSGANRGIIVTTTHYGRDAYEFAKDKPLTLMNGNDLLALLSKHGYKYFVDVDKARSLLT